MNDATIYSIGHGNKNIIDFINELHSFNIEYLFDIRSKPYSKWSPQFNKNVLEASLQNSNIHYFFAGELLGGLPEDKSCYNYDKKIVYERIKDKSFFIKGLEQLIKANSRHIKVAIMCSESKPEECHRSKLIGQELLIKYKISIKHIISKTIIKTQEDVINELTKGHSITNLFGEKIDFTSRKSY